MSETTPYIERLTDYVLQERVSVREEMDVERRLHTPLLGMVDHREGYEGHASTLTDAALDIIEQVGRLGLGKRSKVLILGTATSGIPYAPALAQVIGTSMADAPQFHTGYLLAKRNITHSDSALMNKQAPDIEEYVAEKGYETIQNDEIKRLQELYTDSAIQPDAVVIFDETDWTGETTKVGAHIVGAAFGDSTPVITLSRRADLPWQYDGKAELVITEDGDGKKLTVTKVDERTSRVFKTIAQESIRYIQEAVRGQHPELLEAFPNIEFDLTGEKKLAVLIKEHDQSKVNMQQRIAEMESKGDDYKPIVDVLREHLERQDDGLVHTLALYGLVHHIKQ